MAIIYNPSTLTYEDTMEYAPTDPTARWPSTTVGTGTMTVGGLGYLVAGITSSVNRHKIVGELVDDGYWVKMTGSRVTKDGCTEESDWDYVVYDPERKLGDDLIRRSGWNVGGSGNGTEFSSFRYGDVNLILVDKEEIWKKYIIATNLIKTLNSKTKGERVAVFDSVFGKDSNAKALEF